MKFSPILMFVAAFSSTAKNASAATSIIDVPDSYFTSKGFNETHGNGMVGWGFTVYNTVTVSQVGWYDAGGNGLSRAFQVGLWKDLSGGNFNSGAAVSQLLGSSGSGIVIPGGTTAALNGVWRVVDLPAPLVLSPGKYQLAGLDSSDTTDPTRYFGSMEANFTNSNIGNGDFFFASSNTPSTGFQVTNNGWFYLAGGIELGPMLFAIPEPSSCLLVFFGMVFFGARRRR